MRNCVIFCAGECVGPDLPINPEDIVIAADGGLLHLQKLGLQPNLILGDFDSLGYVPEGANVFPVEKDDTDSMLAVRKGLELGYRRFEIYGALDGDRLDHTIANLQTLHFLAEHGAVGYLVGLRHTVTVVRNGCIRFPKEAKGILSVFCLTQDTKGVCLRGLKYPMENGTLTSGFPLGVSNHFIGEEAVVAAGDGMVTVVYDTVNAFPTEEAIC
mgnify:CR=1 FL=1